MHRPGEPVLVWFNLGKDYGNDSDKLDADDYLAWTTQWIDLALPRLKPSGSLYIFLTWRNSPEIFSMLKKRMLMLNEIIWDRRVPSMGGSTRMADGGASMTETGSSLSGAATGA